MTSRPLASAILDQLQTRSDDLARLRDVFHDLPIIAAHLPHPHDVRLIIDANAALADIRWLVKKRRDPHARTALQEAIASKTVVAFAPSYLDDEIQDKLIQISEREALSLELLLIAWREYRRGIRFYEAARPTASGGTAAIADPKDAPYIETYAAVGAAAILTNDPHLVRMGARTVPFELTVTIRDYARHASVELTLKWHGMMLLTVGVALVHEVLAVLGAIAQALRTAPRGVQVLFGAGLLAILVHRPTREGLSRALNTGGHGALTMSKHVLPVFGELTAAARQAEADAQAAWDRLGPHVIARRVPVRTHALAFCVAEGPLSTDDIVQRLQRIGMNTTSKSFRRYVRRVLRSLDALQEVTTDRWEVTTTFATGDRPLCAG